MNQVLITDEDTQLLTEIGFTETQAKVYLTLFKIGETDARTLSKKTGIPKPEIYRTVRELQKKSLVEKEIASPSKYIATPVHLGLQILMTKKFQKCYEIQKKMKRFLRNHQSCRLGSLQEPDYKIIMVEGRERIMQMMKLQHHDAQQRVDILSTLQRWLQILDFCLEDYVKALERNVKYRVVLEKPIGKTVFPESVKALQAKPNFELEFSINPLKTNGAIFDEKEVTFNFYPSNPLSESSIIWTNHISFLSMFQDQFDKVWKTAHKYQYKNDESFAVHKNSFY